MNKCSKCINHSVKDGLHYCNNRIVRTLRGQLCYCDIPIEDAINTKYCKFKNRSKSRSLKKEAK